MGYFKRKTFYAGKPENPLLFFRIFIKTTFFPKVRQSMLSIELNETELCNMDAKKKLCTKPENPILFFRIFIKTTFFPKVRQSLLCIELYETNLCNFDAKKKLWTNGFWSKIAILCQKTKSKPPKKKRSQMGYGQKLPFWYNEFPGFPAQNDFFSHKLFAYSFFLCGLD